MCSVASRTGNSTGLIIYSRPTGALDYTYTDDTVHTGRPGPIHLTTRSNDATGPGRRRLGRDRPRPVLLTHTRPYARDPMNPPTYAAYVPRPSPTPLRRGSK